MIEIPEALRPKYDDAKAAYDKAVADRDDLRIEQQARRKTMKDDQAKTIALATKLVHQRKRAVLSIIGSTLDGGEEE